MSARQARKRESRRGEPQSGKSDEGQAVEFEQWSEAMRGEFDDFLQQTWEAMSVARKGRWIADTEAVMLEARDRLGRRAYEKLLQLQIEAGQKTFSPSRLSDDGQLAFDRQLTTGGRLAVDELTEQGPQGGDASDGAGTC